ncbi:hypothetical protein ACTQ49_07620 [Luteococcus sp. Sow4_B9]|uniref:hypothetical protein n=1 Tax=Luteococcus sp. Sow4_B9 TaxID=3438792 RepID=UPI003F94E809
MKAEHLRLGWCLVAPTPADDLTPSATQGLWSVAADLNGVQPGPQEWDQWYLDLNAALQSRAASPVPGTVVVELAVDARDAARLLHEAPHANGWRLAGASSPRWADAFERKESASRTLKARHWTSP